LRVKGKEMEMENKVEKMTEEQEEKYFINKFQALIDEGYKMNWTTEEIKNVLQYVMSENVMA